MRVGGHERGGAGDGKIRGRDGDREVGGVHACGRAVAPVPGKSDAGDKVCASNCEDGVAGTDGEGARRHGRDRGGCVGVELLRDDERTA